MKYSALEDSIIMTVITTSNYVYMSDVCIQIQKELKNRANTNRTTSSIISRYYRIKDTNVELIDLKPIKEKKSLLKRILSIFKF